MSFVAVIAQKHRKYYELSNDPKFIHIWVFPLPIQWHFCELNVYSRS